MQLQNCDKLHQQEGAETCSPYESVTGFDVTLKMVKNREPQ